MVRSDLFKFDFDADVSVQDFRDAGAINTALQVHRHVRVRRRNDLVGVLVAQDEWHSLEGAFRELQARVDELLSRIEELDEEREIAAVRAIVEDRAETANFEIVTPELAREIDEELTRRGI
jgi:PHD/YefM family antitoxin component YafN of YafNO toxin-antitoxin module